MLLCWRRSGKVAMQRCGSRKRSRLQQLLIMLLRGCITGLRRHKLGGCIVSVPSAMRCSRWHCPPAGLLKCNIDTSVVGSGFGIRDGAL
ncbi:hypothetical protein PTKIN_Ptkin19aG0006900 [Pterospermum kingtungense]